MNNDSFINYNVTTVRDNTKKLQATIQRLATRMVVVGYPEDKAVARRGETISNASLAFIHDHGSPANHIPPRPFLEPGVHAVERKLQKRLAQGAKAALEGDEAAVDKSLNSVGLDAVSGVRAYIVAGNFSPLKASTLRAYVTGSSGSKGRKRRSDYGNKPLQVTGQLRNAVNYALRNRKGGL